MEPTVIGDASLYLGDCIEVMRTLPANSIDAVVTDPPYGIRFMGKAWDGADIEERAKNRRDTDSHDPSAGPNGAHKSIAAEAGKYDLSPNAMQAFQLFSQEWAAEALRILKPGGHLLCFAAARSYHRMASGIEDAGFEVRDQLMWLYGSGFPKSHNISKAMDAGSSTTEAIRRMQMGENYQPSGRGRANYDHGAGSAMQGEPAEWSPTTDAAKQWDGWGTALKPAHEPILLARKPLAGTVVANVMEHGTGGLNIAACRIEHGETLRTGAGTTFDAMHAHEGRGESTLRTTNYRMNGGNLMNQSETEQPIPTGSVDGRWPANVLHDGSDEVVALFPDAPGQMGEVTGDEPTANGFSGAVSYSGMLGRVASAMPRNDTGSAARFFYCAKASKADRDEGLARAPDRVLAMSNQAKAELARGNMHVGESGMNTAKLRKNHHPTVKPTELMRYLVRLITPPGGAVLDPFMGSGSTGKAALLEHFRFVGIERDPDYFEIAKARIDYIKRSGVQVGLFGEAA